MATPNKNALYIINERLCTFDWITIFSFNFKGSFDRISRFIMLSFITLVILREAIGDGFLSLKAGNAESVPLAWRRQERIIKKEYYHSVIW